MTKVVLRGRKIAKPDDREHGWEVVVSQTTPGRRTAILGNKNLFVPHPYMVFVSSVVEDPSQKSYQARGLKVFFRSEPLRSIDDPLYLTCFDNCGHVGDVCLPLDYDIWRSNLDEAANDAITAFWRTGFHKYGWPLEAINGGDFRQLVGKDPQFMVDIDWSKQQNYLIRHWKNLYGGGYYKDQIFTLAQFADEWEGS